MLPLILIQFRPQLCDLKTVISFHHLNWLRLPLHPVISDHLLDILCSSAVCAVENIFFFIASFEQFGDLLLKLDIVEDIIMSLGVLFGGVLLLELGQSSLLELREPINRIFSYDVPVVLSEFRLVVKVPDNWLNLSRFYRFYECLQFFIVRMEAVGEEMQSALECRESFIAPTRWNDSNRVGVF